MNRSHKSVNKISFIQNKTKLFLGGECPELSFFFFEHHEYHPVFIGRTDAKAPVFWPPDEKN